MPFAAALLLKGPSLAAHRIVAGAGALALTLTLLAPVGQVEVSATPVTLSETLEGLPAADAAVAASDSATADVDPATSEAPDADRGEGAGSEASSVPQRDAGPDSARWESPGSGGLTTAGVAGASTTEDLDLTELAEKTSSVSARIEAPLTFSAVGFTAPAAAELILMRSSEDGETWSDWSPAAFVESIDGPDAGTDEAQAARAAATGDAGEVLQHTEPIWVGEASHVQIEVFGTDAGEVSAEFIDSMGLSGGPVERRYDTQLGNTADAATDADLDVISRAEWGADENWTSGSVHVADEVNLGVVHHTAHAEPAEANTYSEAEAPGILRAMYRYHTKSLGWSDLGYNVVIDRFGNVYEGRRGGFDNGVIGAHARGFNTGSFGVSVIGSFLDGWQASDSALNALEQVLGVKSAIHGINPTGWTDGMADGQWRPTIIGHRNVGQTSCPGRIMEVLPELRVAADGYAVRFPDVPLSSVHRESILRLADDGVTTGCRLNEFCPEDGLNRAQASSFVVRAFGLEPIPGSAFPDVGADGAHASSINVLVEKGWLLGRADGTFGPWEELKRGQLLTLLARAAGLELTRPLTDPYPDVSRDATHAPGIAALKEHGVVGNCGAGRFCANDTALRDSTASFVDMVRELIDELAQQDQVATDDGVNKEDVNWWEWEDDAAS